jgi:hypothetical protein
MGGLRLRGLSQLDPLAVPLPHGTEVTTRVDRILLDRRIPQGAVGRVVGSDDDGFEVHIVGVGVARYARHELLPRKLGQVRFAERRETAWTSLRECAVLEATVGSHAWGLADEKSDVDRRGVFVLPFPWASGLSDPPRVLVSADGSETLWEIDAAVRQALRADPNTLELLFVNSTRALDVMGEWLLEAREAFVTAEIYGSFGRYALSQLKRLQQSLALAEHREVVIAWLREDPPPTLDETARRLADVSRRVAPSRADLELQSKQYVKQLYRSLFDQGLLAGRSYEALVEFARTKAAELDLPRDLRPKNAYNLVRLVATAIDWLRSGSPQFEVRGALREQLLAIKHGHVPLDEVLRIAEGLTPALEEARHHTPLPLHPDVGRVDELLRRVRTEAARRWIQREPGPFGADAPEAPVVVWQEE